MFEPESQSNRHQHRLRGLGCKIASTLDEWRDAFALLHDSYVRAGLSEPRACGLRVIPHHLLPTTSTLIAQFDGEILGTMTLIRDSRLGMPMEIVYPRDIDDLRRRGIIFAEVSCLATRTLSLTDYPYVFMRLMRLLAQHARFLCVERLVIAAHPRHAAFYKRSMGFRQFGRETSYPSVRGAPAVAAYLDFEEADRLRPRFYDDCFGSAIHEAALRPRVMPRDVVDYFIPFTEDLDCEEVSGSAVHLDEAATLALAASPGM